jgi:hypothetical protein
MVHGMYNINIVSNTAVEKIKTRVLFTITFSENRAFYEIMWKNTVEPDRLQRTI